MAQKLARPHGRATFPCRDAPSTEVSEAVNLYELAVPGDTDWIHFGRFTEPGPGVRGIAEDWTRVDERNPCLDEVIPGRFVRAAVIKMRTMTSRSPQPQGAP